MIDHFSGMDVQNLDVFESLNAYRNIHAWMLLPFEDYYRNVNNHPPVQTHCIQQALLQARSYLDNETDILNSDTATQPSEPIRITKSLSLEALKTITPDQA